MGICIKLRQSNSLQFIVIFGRKLNPMSRCYVYLIHQVGISSFSPKNTFSLTVYHAIGEEGVKLYVQFEKILYDIVNVCIFDDSIILSYVQQFKLKQSFLLLDLSKLSIYHT